MNKLFTNIEQSKKLLDAGVPIDSADCKIDSFGNILVRSDEEIVCGWHESNIYFPCWSLGTLIVWSIKSMVKTSYISYNDEDIYHIPKAAVDRYIDNVVNDIITGLKDGFYGI